MSRKKSSPKPSPEDVAAEAIAADDPERIYTFAGHLDAALNEEEAEADRGPAPRMETWITFGLAGETFALPVTPVREVLRVSGITRVPHAPAPIRGVSQLRGRVIPVVDLRLRLGLDAAGEPDRASRILVVASRQHHLGLLVDRVDQVVHLDRNQTQPPPEDVVTVATDFFVGVHHLDDELLLLLDVDRVLVVRDVGSEA